MDRLYSEFEEELMNVCNYQHQMVSNWSGKSIKNLLEKSKKSSLNIRDKVSFEMDGWFVFYNELN